MTERCMLRKKSEKRMEKVFCMEESNVGKYRKERKVRVWETGSELGGQIEGEHMGMFGGWREMDNMIRKIKSKHSVAKGNVKLINKARASKRA